jgi:type IV secretory pathway TrbD component
VPAPARKCANCGGGLTRKARFCPECGTRVDADDEQAGAAEAPTESAALPPTETGPVPVTVATAEPRLFGVTPPMLVLALGVAALAVGVLLLVSGHWLAGLLSLGASVLLLAAFAEVARRKPDSRVVRASAGVLGAARARAGVAVDVVAIRSRVSRELVRARAELLRLSGERRERFRELGEAVYADDEEGTKRLRAELTRLDEEIEAKEAEMQRIAAEAHDRLERVRLEVKPTEMVEIPELPSPGPVPEPSPAPVPEPQPPAIPEPSPVPIPEPYPPDEITPPEPARIPEPGPLGRKRSPRSRKSRK